MMSIFNHQYFVLFAKFKKDMQSDVESSRAKNSLSDAECTRAKKNQIQFMGLSLEDFHFSQKKNR